MKKGMLKEKLQSVTRPRGMRALTEKEEREADMAELPFIQEEEVGVEEVLNGEPGVEKTRGKGSPTTDKANEEPIA